MVDLDNPRTRGAQIQAADIGVIVGYFALVMLFGLWSSCKNRGSVGGYFLAGRSMHFIPVGASLFASNIGSGHFIGLAGSGAASGIGIAGFELNALFILLILGWVFVPVYISAGVYTMPEYLRKRFGGQRIRVYLAVMALLLSIFTKVAADLYAGAIFIELSLGWNLYASIMLLLVIAAVFTIIGGLTAVIWTDFIQTVIMIIGAFYLMIVSFLEVGSYDTMVEKYFQAVPNTTRYYENHPQAAPHLSNYSSCGVPPANSMHLLRAHDDGGLPWPGMVFGLTISSIWYWCSDQVIVQRALAAKNLSHAKGGTIVAAYLKILPMWLLVIPGMISRILFPNHVGCAEPAVCEEVCESPNGCTNFAYPMLVLNLLPTGARGLMLAVMIAALMSSLTSIFNSSSTIFTMDVWRRIRRSAGDTELLIVGRIFVLFMVAVGIIWIPIVQNFAELFHYIQSITSYLAPPVCAVYVLAILWKRTNEQGAFWSLVVGLVVGLIRFIWEFSYTKPSCGEEYKDKRPAIIKDVHYLHFGIILFVITFIVAVVVSLLTKPIEDKYLHRLLYWNRFSKEERIDLPDEKSRDSGHDNQAADISTISYGQQQHGSTNHIGNEEELPCWRKSFNWICGIEKQPDVPELTAEAMKAMEEKQNSLDEKPLWRRVNNINAILVMTIAIFFWGFFY